MPFLRVHSRKAIVLTLVVLCTLQLAPTHGEEWCTFLYEYVLYYTSYYTDFYEWYERQGRDLQEDHWRLRCGTMTTMDPLDEVNNRWCDEQAEVFRNCEREGGVCVN